MSEPAIVLDPFIQITDIHVGGWRWRFSFCRDDGLCYSPVAAERLTIQLFAQGGGWLFSGQSTPEGGTAGGALPYEEALPGLVHRFRFQNGYYELVLKRGAWEAVLGPVVGKASCILVTTGSNTLTTRFPRAYLADQPGSPIPPGMWAVTLPFWSVTTTESYPNLLTTVQQSLVRSSIPYQANYRLRDANSFAWFLLPVLGVVFRPNATLTDWIGLLQVDHLCDWGAIIIPWQQTGIPRPPSLPTSPADRIFQIHHNIKLLIAMGPCAERWPGTAIEVTTDFGYQTTLSFCPPGLPTFADDYPLGPQTGTLTGRLYRRQYRFQWDRESFLYNTGEGAQQFLQQTATLVQSPASYFDTLLLQPLPEQGG
ncbi:MAG: hypothetical protein HQL90_11995 [Magnetococcales bacterium]|nr:hypothetical protein [Magnetococcales bacterium]